MIPQEPIVRRSPGYLLVVVRLDAVLDSGVVASVSSIIVCATWPAPILKGSAHSRNLRFSELRVRFRATPFTSLHSLLFLSSLRFQSFRYRVADYSLPGEAFAPVARSSSTGNHCQVTQYSRDFMQKSGFARTIFRNESQSPTECRRSECLNLRIDAKILRPGPYWGDRIPWYRRPPKSVVQAKERNRIATELI